MSPAVRDLPPDGRAKLAGAASAADDGSVMRTKNRAVWFVAVGAAGAVVQLGLLAVLTEFTSFGRFSNAAAFLISAQLNFLLSSLLTWADRETGGRRSIAWRLLRFNALISVAAVANQAIYLAFERMLPYLLAGAIALVVTAVAKYFIADRWVFPGAGKKQQIRAGGASVHPGVAE